jgi:hypothetical protein
LIISCLRWWASEAEMDTHEARVMVRVSFVVAALILAGLAMLP